MMRYTFNHTCALAYLFAVSSACLAQAAHPDKESLDQRGYHEFNYGQNTDPKGWVQTITVSEPRPRMDISGKVVVRFKAPGMTQVRAFCWRQPTPEIPSSWGHDALLTPQGVNLNANGEGEFIFPADDFPNGPTNIRIFAHDGRWNGNPASGGKRDLFELQLYNIGGVVWNQGIPKNDPPGAKGLKLIFADDFDGPLSVSKDGKNARYCAHKPRFGDFSGWHFSDPAGDGRPFSQKGTYLRICARKEPGTQGRTGLLSSVNWDGAGIWAKAPAYLECRFTAQSAPGTWPAFWTITHLDKESPIGDELDVVEAYGGVGAGNPNHPGYSIVSHFWGQKTPDGKSKKARSATPNIMELGGKSYWSTTFHTYAVRIDPDQTIYYFDDIEVLRHPTNDVSRDYPHCFLINLAIGGSSRWPIDLARYGNGSDMWVDYVRVYAEKEISYVLPPPQKTGTQ